MAEGAGLGLTAAAAAARRLVRIPLIASPPPAISARRLAAAARPASAGAQCPGAPGAQRIHSDPVHLLGPSSASVALCSSLLPGSFSAGVTPSVLVSHHAAESLT